MSQDEGRGALVGEFMEAFFSASKDIQDEIIFHAVKRCFSLNSGQLIAPYPVLTHLQNLINKTNDN